MFKNPLFWLPFFLYLGVAGQLIGLVLCGIVLPGLFYYKKLQAHNYLNYRYLGLSLIALWSISPLWNLIHYLFFVQQEVLIVKKIFKSHIPSGVVISGLGFVVFSYLAKNNPATTISKNNTTEVPKPLKIFYYGLLVAVIVVFSCGVIQSYSGYNFLRPQWQINFGGLHRITVFSTHTLIFASIVLTLTCFFGASFFLTHRNKHIATSPMLIIISAMVFIANIMLLSMNFSRTALAIGLAYAAILLIAYFVTNSFSLKAKVVAFVSVVISGFFIYLRSGGLSNLLNRVHTSDARFDIWSAHIKMFLLKPWFGHGYIFLTSKYKSSFYPLKPEYYYGFAAHNIYLQSLTEMGILGSIAIVIILFFLLKTLKNLFYQKHFFYTNLYLKCFLLAVAANAVHSLTQNVFLESSVVAVYLILLWFIFWLHVAEENNTKSLS